MAAVARALLRREDAGDRDVEAVSLPVDEPAGEVHDLVVAHIRQRLGGERGAGTDGAVDDEGASPVRHETFDARLETPARDVDRAGDMPLLPLVGLPHVDEERGLGVGVQLVRLDRGDLLDLLLHLREQLAIAGHYFPNYSFGFQPFRDPTSGYRRPMTARRRIVLLVGVVALAAVALVAAAVSSSGGSDTTEAGEPDPRPGRPPLSFALGFRDDAEAKSLARAQARYAEGDAHAAAALFARHESLEAKVGAAFVTWPEGTFDRMEQLAKLYPDAAVVRFHQGLARLWAQRDDPVEAWQAAIDAEPDTPYALLAGNLLFPKLPRGLPTFVPSFSAPAAITRLPPARQLDALRRTAARGGTREQLLYGVGLQRVGRPVSAARVFDRAAREDPADAEAQVASAVGRFDKADPARAFGSLGPLTRRFPGEPSVRFHLGVLLLWTGRVDAAQTQFRRASRIDAGSPLAREAARYLETIRKARS